MNTALLVSEVVLKALFYTPQELPKWFAVQEIKNTY